MTKKLEETFNLPAIEDVTDIEDEATDLVESYSESELHALMERADKIDAALPQVSGLDSADTDYDTYATKAIDAFDDLLDLGKNVEDRHAAEIFNAASNMMSNALNAKTNKVEKKLKMVKLQLEKAKLEHEQEKLEYLKKRHLGKGEGETAQETEGQVIASRNDLLADILADMKKSDK